MIRPVIFRWDGEAMRPWKRFSVLCDRQFVVGEDYRLGPDEERTRESEGHYFASLKEAWQNLPPEIAGEFPDVEHLRKHALIRTGFCDKRTIVWATKTDAQQFASLVGQWSEYEVITIDGTVTTVYTAHSQSRSAMKKKEFEASKNAVLDYAWGLSRVTPPEHRKHGGRAA